jgi:MFS family permease
MLRNPVALLRGLPPTVRILVAGTFVNKLGSFIIPFLAIVLKREFRLSGTQVGALVMAYGAGSLVAVLSGGLLTDRLGRRLTLLTSLFGSGTLAVLLGFAPSMRAFATLLILFGFVADLYRPASTSIIADVLPSAQRAVGFAALRMAINLGFAMGMTVGGLLADWSWRLLFVGDGLTTILFGALVYFFIPETRPAAAADPVGRSASAPRASSPWRDGVFLQVMAVSFAFALMFFSHITALPITMTVNAGYPARLYGMLIGTNGLLIALFEVSVVHRLHGWRRLRVAALGTALAGLGFGLSGVILHWAWFLVTVVIWTAGEIFSMPFNMAFVTDWAPPASRGQYMSLYQATWSVAVALNPILFLPLQARMGDRFWPLMMVLAAPAVLVLLHLDRVADRPERLRGLAHAPAADEQVAMLAPAPLQG